MYIRVCPIPNGFRDRAISLYNSYGPHKGTLKMHSDEQRAMSSHELQSALMLTVGFSKIYYTS
jgi:hypothetical protein